MGAYAGAGCVRRYQHRCGSEQPVPLGASHVRRHASEWAKDSPDRRTEIASLRGNDSPDDGAVWRHAEAGRENVWRVPGSAAGVREDVGADHAGKGASDVSTSSFGGLSGGHYRAGNYEIEPDVSGACYFYAMALILGISVRVKGVHPDSLQGDLRFLEVLESLGCEVCDTPEGIRVTGPADGNYPGITVNMNEFSDQTMTMAAVAAFAGSPTRIEGVAHIRYQESNRIEAIHTELERLGIRCEEFEDGITIYPAPVQPALVRTYEDHRMAMAFALIGLRADGVVIDDPGCCAKTFERYFEILDGITATAEQTGR